MPKLLVVAAFTLVPLTAVAEDGFAPPSATPPQPEAAAPCTHQAWHATHRRPRLAVGIAKGGIGLRDDAGDDERGRQMSIIARAQGRRGFGVELELAKTRLSDGDDTMRSGGVALYKAFGKRRLAPYVIAGAGGGRIDHADGAEQRMRYAEAGGGVMLRGRRLAVGIDVRKGVRKLGEVETAGALPMMTSPAMVTPDDDDGRDRYVRGRVMMLVQF